MSGTAEPQATLVLPGGLTESLAFRRSASSRGLRLVGASSVHNDPAREKYDEWCYVPSVHDTGFEAAFCDALKVHNISTVYSPHGIIHSRLTQLAAKLGHSFELSNPRPTDELEENVQEDIVEARRHLAFMQTLGTGGAMLDEREIAGLLRATRHIAGQSDEDKLSAIMAVFPELPRGDIVEIGGFWGRSAYVLAWLAGRYQVGSALVVDPWAVADALQMSAPEIVRADTKSQNWDLVHQGFILNLVPIAHGRLGYLRMSSADAVVQYSAFPAALDSPPFGLAQFTGAVSLLHIDGNHDEEAVTLDIEKWVGRVQPGGWLVLDDYVWPHGDGPYRAGNALLDKLADRSLRSFVAGKALFIQLG